MSDYIDARHVSAELKRQLTTAFPGVKFSVRRGRGTGSAAIDVSWTDGPDREPVEAIAHPMVGSRWNGADDRYERTGNQVTVTIDGKRVTGQPVVNHIGCQREVSDEVMAEAAALWSAAHDGAEPAGMADDFTCEKEWIRQGWASSQVQELARLVVLPRRWAVLQEAAAAKAAAIPAKVTKEKTTPAPAAEGLAIAHSEEGGIHVTGTQRGDGSRELLKAEGFRWYRKGSCWYLPGTRTTEAADRLAAVRTALQQVGMTFANAQPAPAAEEPAAAVEVAEPVEEPPAIVTPAQATAARRLRSVPQSAVDEEAVMGDVREYISDAPGIGARTAAAATAVIGQKLRSGVLREDHLTGTLPAATAAITAKAVRDMRAQGLTHEQIKQRLERKRAEAQQARNLGRVTVADAMLAAHAGIVADEEAKARPAVTGQVPELEPAAPRTALEAPAPKPEPTVLAGRPGMDAGAHRIVNTSEDLVSPGSAYAFRCLNCDQRARLADFDGLRCTETAELEYAEARARRLLDDHTLRAAQTLEVNDGDRVVTMGRAEAEQYLSNALRFDASHRWTREGLRLTRNDRPVASIRPAPETAADTETPQCGADLGHLAWPFTCSQPIGHGGLCDPQPGPKAPAAPADYRNVPVPADIAEAWEQPTGGAWRAGVDSVLSHAGLAQAPTP